jgi:catechol 2,3-dioxygenase-like lactoylglutathione lyase family enzyme
MTPLQAPSRGVSRKGIPTATNVDHVAYTVPDLDQAVEFFVDVLGADLLYRLDSVKDDEGDWMRRQLGVDPRAKAQIAMLRLGPVTNVELFQYEAPDQSRQLPKNSDHGGHHLAFYVEDIEAATEYLRAQPGVTLLGDVQTIEDGPIAGDRWVYFLAPWGMQMEILHMPHGMPYERATPARRYGPCEDPWSPQARPDGRDPHQRARDDVS